MFMSDIYVFIHIYMFLKYKYKCISDMNIKHVPQTYTYTCS
jgi:hypothetical protein